VYDQISSNKLRSAALIFAFVLLVALIGYVFGQATDWGYLGLVLALVVAFVMSWGSTPWRGWRSRPDFPCRART
jgi:membrane protein YdbS with pleckstrin-like domain